MMNLGLPKFLPQWSGTSITLMIINRVANLLDQTEKIKKMMDFQPICQSVGYIL